MNYFSGFGQIFSAKVAKDRSKKCKGHGKVCYLNIESMNKCLAVSQHIILGKAVKVEEFLDGKKLVKHEFENTKNRVAVFGLPKETTEEKLREMFLEYGSILKVLLKSKSYSKYAFVEFESKKVAKLLKKKGEILIQDEDSGQRKLLIKPYINKQVEKNLKKIREEEIPVEAKEVKKPNPVVSKPVDLSPTYTRKNKVPKVLIANSGNQNQGKIERRNLRRNEYANGDLRGRFQVEVSRNLSLLLPVFYLHNFGNVRFNRNGGNMSSEY